MGRPTWESGPLPWLAGRGDRRLGPDLRLRPLARAGQAWHQLLRHVLDHGLPADFRGHPRHKLPTDRPIDGVDQTDVLSGKSEMGNRESLLTFIGADLVAVRWKQWRLYFKDMALTGTGRRCLAACM